MYSHMRYTTRVRDGAARYGGAPVPSEDFPGAGAFQELAGAATTEIPLIVARYTALRAWALSVEAGDAAVVEHALSAALEHLAATDDGWAEKAPLTAALADRSGPCAGRPRAGSLALLLEAAECAERLGHGQGARALREAVHRARWATGSFPPPSLS